MNEITTTKINEEVILQKRNAWANLGESIYHAEMKLQGMAQQLILQVKLPNTIEDVKESEFLLKELKGQLNRIESERKTLTSKLDSVTTRLMLHEKSVPEHLKKLQDKIIELKKQEEDQIKKSVEKQKEIQRITELCKVQRSEIEFKLKQLIGDVVNKSYSYALGDGNIHPHQLNVYLEKVRSKVTEERLINEVNLIYSNAKQTSTIINEAELFDIIDQQSKVDVYEYIEIFNEQLVHIYSDYNIAFNNKEEALKKSEQERIEKEKQDEEKRQNEQIAAKIESVITPQVTIDFKPLKKMYEVDMPEDIDSVRQIMSAFFANINLCLPKLRVNKWFSFTPKQAAASLANVKNDDNEFQPKGIVFKEVSKL